MITLQQTSYPIRFNPPSRSCLAQPLVSENFTKYCTCLLTENVQRPLALRGALVFGTRVPRASAGPLGTLRVPDVDKPCSLPSFPPSPLFPFPSPSLCLLPRLSAFSVSPCHTTRDHSPGTISTVRLYNISMQSQLVYSQSQI